MKTVNEKILTRQQKLKIWFIETEFDASSLVKKFGVSRQALSQELFYRPSMRPESRDICIKAGIPVDLLPPPTRPKAELLRENLELRARLAQYEPQAQAS